MMEMYMGASTMVRTVNEDSQHDRVEVGLHQCSALSPFLFVMVMEVLNDNIRDRELWELLFTDDQQQSQRKSYIEECWNGKRA